MACKAIYIWTILLIQFIYLVTFSFSVPHPREAEDEASSIQNTRAFSRDPPSDFIQRRPWDFLPHAPQRFHATKPPPKRDEKITGDEEFETYNELAYFLSFPSTRREWNRIMKQYGSFNGYLHLLDPSRVQAYFTKYSYDGREFGENKDLGFVIRIFLPETKISAQYGGKSSSPFKPRVRRGFRLNPETRRPMLPGVEPPTFTLTSGSSVGPLLDEDLDEKITYPRREPLKGTEEYNTADELLDLLSYKVDDSELEKIHHGKETKALLEELIDPMRVKEFFYMQPFNYQVVYGRPIVQEFLLSLMPGDVLSFNNPPSKPFPKPW